MDPRKTEVDGRGSGRRSEDAPESLGSRHDMRFEDLRERHRLMRHQLQMAQSERDEAVKEAQLAQSKYRMLWKKSEELKRERGELQKKLEQHRGVPRYDRESLAKRYDQVCAQMRHLQHEKEQMEQRVQQEKQELEARFFMRQKQDKLEVEARFLDDLKSLKASLEDAEQDRDNLRYQLSELKRDNERLTEQLACVGPNYDTTKREVEKIIDQRDQLRSVVRDLQHDKQLLQGTLAEVRRSPGKGATHPDTPPDARVAELQTQVSGLQGEGRALRAERDRLSETSSELRSKVEGAEGRVRELEAECQRLRHSLHERDVSPSGQVSGGRLGNMTALSRGSSEELLMIKRHRSSQGSLGVRGRFSQGSTDEDFPLHSDSSSNDLIATERERSHSFETKKKLSSSTSNLSSGLTGSSDIYERTSSHSRLTEVNARLRAKLTRYEKSFEQLRRDNTSLSGQVTRLDQEKSDIESQLLSKSKELEALQMNLSKANSQYNSAKSQAEMMAKEKGIAMRDNAASYQQSIQRESQLRELQAEKEILEQQRDIANKERERVIGEAVALKKKLEAIKAQRQKDAKDLSGMRHLKVKAVAEMTELRKAVEEAQARQKASEEELVRVQEAISRASLKVPVSRQRAAGKGGSLSLDLQLLLERLQSVEHERKVVNKKLFGPDGPDQSLSDTLHKIELLYQERDNLVVEIEALQHSSSKLNEERIFELKQRIEDIMVERDTLSAQRQGLKREVSSLSSKLIKTGQERDKVAIDCERLELQVQQLKNTTTRLVEDHTKTLERVNELWKQKWPPAWDEAWEEKHLTVPLGQDGFAGFSVVGGRDQPQLPNPGAFIITMVNQGGPAEGILKVGDILATVNGVSLTNADHREAVRAVKESKGLLAIVVRRRRNAYPIQMGIVSAVNSVPHLEPTPATRMEQHEYSLYITGRDSPGFRYDFKSIYTVSEVTPTGPANQILEPGDRIIKVNNISITHEKPSAVKKLMKPHNKIMRVLIERPQKTDCTGQPPYATTTDWARLEKPGSSPPLNPRKTSWTPSGASTPNGNRSKSSRNSYRSDEDTTQNSQGSSDLGPDVEHLPDSSCRGAAAAERRQRKRELSRYQKNSRDSYSSESYSQETQSFSQDSCKPTKLVSVVTRVKRDPEDPQVPTPPRPMSDGVVYGNYNERRIEYEDVLLSERTDSQFSQSESCISEGSYGDYALSSSQSIDLTFHSQTMLSHNRLTVETMMPTQNEASHSQHSDDDEGFGRFLARDDASRTTFRNRSCEGINPNSNANNSGSQLPESQLSESQLSESQLSYPSSLSSRSYGHRRHSSNGGGIKRKLFRGRQRKSNTMYASRSLTKLSSSENHNSRTNGSLGASRGRSRSNLSLGHAPSMTSVIEEPRRSTSTSNVSNFHAHDPLADATYIRANFTYIPRSPRELGIKTGDVFHIHDEAPSERFRASFWVSRLSSDGTDEQIGAIPNSMKAQEYVEAQGECLDIPLYEEVEAYTGRRPVLIFGALADQVTASLLEGFPTLFYPCPTDTVEGVARITEARLKREVSEGKIIDFRRSEVGFDVIRMEAMNSKQNKGKHCLLMGSIQALQSLKSLAPPISILIKPMTEESITTFSPEQISLDHAREVYEEVMALEDQHLHEFSASLFLIYMETLMGQIEDIVKKEKRKQAWVPITKET